MVVMSFLVKNRIKIVTLVFTIFMIIFGVVINGIWHEVQEEQHNLARLNAQNRIISLIRDIEETYGVVSSLDILLTDGGTFEIKDFDGTAKKLMQFHPFIDSLQLAPQGKVTQIYPLAGNESGMIDLINDEKRGPISRYSRDNHRTTLQGPFIMKQGGMGIAVRHPVYMRDAAGKEKFWGFTIAIIRVPDVFHSTVETLDKFGYAYALYNDEPISNQWALVIKSEKDLVAPETKYFQVLGTEWKLSVEPVGGWSGMQEIFPQIIAGLFLVLLLTAMTNMLLLLERDKQIFVKMSLKDELTGMGNKRSFDYALEYLFNNKEKFGLFYVDVNFFKEINDTYGHNIGDLVLEKIAKRLSEVAGYHVYRLGGDEFAILVDEDISEDVYMQIKKRLEKTSAKTMQCQDVKLTVMVSIGFARYPQDGQSLQQLLENADGRMYKDKAIKHQNVKM